MNSYSHCETICDDAVVCCNAYLSEDAWQDHGWIPQVIVRGLARSVAQCTADISVCFSHLLLSTAVVCSVARLVCLQGRPRTCPADSRGHSLCHVNVAVDALKS